MLNKNLIKVVLLLTFSSSLIACQSEAPTRTSQKAIEVSYEDSDETPKKLSSNKWAEFQSGFKKKTSVSEAVHTARVDAQKDEIMKEYGMENPKRTITMTDRIDLKKWEEFQTAFKARAAYYINNISDVVN